MASHNLQQLLHYPQQRFPQQQVLRTFLERRICLRELSGAEAKGCAWAAERL